MIKFFRRIRQSLLKESKFSKYLLYAIGEIVLVVIGILIALQINEWNAERKNNLLESEYYCRLLEDLRQDGVQTDALIEQAENRLKASNQAVRLLFMEKTNSIDIGQQMGLATKAIYIDFKPNNSTFEDLKSSNLNIIKDKRVIETLNNYYNTVESLKSIIMVNGKHAVDVSFDHDDGFKTGQTQSSLLSGGLRNGMDSDVLNLFSLDSSEVISKSTQQRLLNEALVYLASNTRQLELYNIMKDHSVSVASKLQAKCKENHD